MKILEEMYEQEKNESELSKIKKEMPFGVPDKYFDDFSARLHHRLEAEKQNLPQPKNQIIRFLKPALGLTASFALIFMLVYWPIKSFLPDYLAKMNAAEFIEPESDEHEFLTAVEMLDENSFFALLDESTIEHGISESKFNDAELLNYLSSNVTDYEIYLQTEN
ncbi:hypothetical protein SAMN05444274_10117 [Mariniphaga anaerophila]|uniref:Uncharacterized protein n=1 Tax=Mariniphaga anaerophila TaxID=1484053 RepID=A0A1M4SFY1_9BACT|nr:hypothetical protein [Mariniphaga anaerophila]SHE31174.1 hypothetical protein SAMN05444274_10117 [Mariniphaga anaerophila]